MQGMNVRSLLTSRRIVNMFGAIGYSVLIVAYAVVVGTILMWLVRSGYGEAVGVLPPATVDPSTNVATELPDPAGASLGVSIVGYAIAAIMLVTVVFVTITLPYWLGKSGSYLLKRAIRLFSISVTPMTLLLAKLLASGVVWLPVLLIAAEDIGNLLTLLFVAGLMALTVVLFLLQHYLARMTHLEAKNIW